MLEKFKIAMKGLLAEIWTLKTILVRAQKGKKKAAEKAFIFLKDTYIIMTRMLVEMWILKTILVKSQIETKNSFQENGGKIIPVIKCNFAKMHFSVF